MWKTAKDLTGMKLHMLSPIERVGTTEDKNALWLCKCDCGGETKVKANSLLTGNSKSCGCRKNKGQEKPWSRRLYLIRSDMKRRCNSEKHKSFHNYGGRGITVCDEWESSMESFYEWAKNNGYQEHLTIERINVDKGYEPENCTWIPLSEQNKNKRNSPKNKE